MKTNQVKLLLASASERRKRLLSEAGCIFDSISPDIEESNCSRSPRNTVLHNADLKCMWALDRHPSSAIIAADTAIDFNGVLIGKPDSMNAAREQLQRFSGQAHNVLTGVVFYHPEDGFKKEVCQSRVIFRNLTDRMIADYFALVNPLDKAGSYDIGSHGDLVVETFSGSFTNIVGLPMEVITPILKTHNFL